MILVVGHNDFFGTAVESVGKAGVFGYLFQKALLIIPHYRAVSPH